MKELPPNVLLDADVLFSYLKGDELSAQAEKLVLKAGNGEVKLYVSSEVYDDIVSALRSDGVSLDLVADFLADVNAIPHTPIPMIANVAEEALRLYQRHRGPRKLHCFDSYHIATARWHNLPLVTTDEYIIKHSGELDVLVIDLASLR